MEKELFKMTCAPHCYASEPTLEPRPPRHGVTECSHDQRYKIGYMRDRANWCTVTVYCRLCSMTGRPVVSEGAPDADTVKKAVSEFEAAAARFFPGGKRTLTEAEKIAPPKKAAVEPLPAPVPPPAQPPSKKKSKKKRR